MYLNTLPKETCNDIAGLKVLIVDDEIAIQRFLRVALNGQGFIVSEAANGQDALASTGNGTP